jgi:parvulin-like peptidyl-prolyl isomerase
MTAIVRIDDEVVDVGEFIRLLKLTGQFESLIEQMVRDKLTVHAAKKHGLTVSADEIQERADQFRRVRGLHRAADMNQYLDTLKVGLDEFETFVTDSLYQEKMLDKVGSEAEIEEYFSMNSPKFDAIEVSHILLDDEGKAKEMISYLHDDPDAFAEMAREHSIADTKDSGGWRSARAVRFAGPLVLRDLCGDGEISGTTRRGRRVGNQAAAARTVADDARAGTHYRSALIDAHC